MSEARDFEAALEALGAERELYARMLELTREQRKLAEGGRAEELLAVLAEKGKLADEAARLGEASRELKSEWGAISGEMSEADRARGEKLIEEIRGTLSEILTEEEACQKLAGQRREGAMEDILRAQKGRRMARAYGKKPPPEPRFKDEKK